MSLGVIVSIIQKNKYKETTPLECDVNIKELNDNEIAFRSKGEFIFMEKEREVKVNAVESAISITVNKRNNSKQTELLLTTHTLSSKDSWPINTARITFSNDSTVVLETKEHMKAALNEDINIVGNLFVLNEEILNKLMKKNIKSILMETDNDSYIVEPFQNYIRASLNALCRK